MTYGNINGSYLGISLVLEYLSELVYSDRDADGFKLGIGDETEIGISVGSSEVYICKALWSSWWKITCTIWCS